MSFVPTAGAMSTGGGASEYRADLQAAAGMASGASHLARRDPAAAAGVAHGALVATEQLAPRAAYYGGFVALQQARQQLTAGIASNSTAAGAYYDRAAEALLRAAAQASDPMP